MADKAKKDIDLLAGIAAAGGSKKNINIFAAVLPAVLGGVVAAAVLAAGAAAESSAEKELEQARRKTALLEKNQAIAQLEETESRQSSLEAAFAAAESISEKQGSTPDFSPDMLDEINVKLSGVSCRGGRIYADRLELDFFAQNREDISPFVKKLEDKNLFSYIDYQGFEETSGGCGFSLVCYTSENEKEAAQ